mmetsp:Transcript_30538/g.59658  ORF Transcript_30538/g.59658 Transcript_30538/m.59658 type:complete len:368 (-) Transcript_30538:180-1283(-)
MKASQQQQSHRHRHHRSPLALAFYALGGHSRRRSSRCRSRRRRCSSCRRRRCWSRRCRGSCCRSSRCRGSCCRSRRCGCRCRRGGCRCGLLGSLVGGHRLGGLGGGLASRRCLCCRGFSSSLGGNTRRYRERDRRPRPQPSNLPSGSDLCGDVALLELNNLFLVNPNLLLETRGERRLHKNLKSDQKTDTHPRSRLEAPHDVAAQPECRVLVPSEHLKPLLFGLIDNGTLGDGRKASLEGSVLEQSLDVQVNLLLVDELDLHAREARHHHALRPLGGDGALPPARRVEAAHHRRLEHLVVGLVQHLLLLGGAGGCRGSSRGGLCGRRLLLARSLLRAALLRLQAHQRPPGRRRRTPQQGRPPPCAAQ